MINTQSTNMPVSDYVSAMDRNEIVVNSHYQRSDKVWPDSAKSYLIESILLGYPVPKFFLFAKSDPKDRRLIREIVDGQQRSVAIREFLADKIVLSNSLDTAELRGHTYSSLDEDWQGKFISYILSVDQFVATDAKSVRQVFRRMNSYTVPLNPEELRHADNQGDFKWFIYSIGQAYSEILLSMGIFSDKQIVRMQDLKLFTEVASAIDLGVTTTSRKKLDDLYKKFDDQFERKQEFDTLLNFAFSNISELDYIRDTELAKPYQIYSMAVALIELRQERGEDLEVDLAAAKAALLALANAVEVGSREERFRTFVDASAERTNVKAQRELRAATFKQIFTSASV